MLGDTNNTINLGNLYPAAKSFAPSVGSEADSIGVDTEHITTLSSVEKSFSQAVVLGQPVAAYIAILVLVIAAMLVATHYAGEKAANVKFSLYNIFIVTLLSIIGGAGFKIVAAKFSHRLGPVATVVLAS